LINAVTTASPSSAWAVGSFITKAGPFGKPYVAHWNGHAWKQVSAPLGFLSGAVSTSTRNTWVVGGTGGDGLDFPLVLRSKGGSWTRAHVPMPPTGGHFFGVAATSSSNAWAVGLGYGSSIRAFIVRWNGSAWKQVRTPRLGSSALNGVAATSAGNAWAVGHTGPASRPTALILRWNGSTWK